MSDIINFEKPKPAHSAKSRSHIYTVYTLFIAMAIGIYKASMYPLYRVCTYLGESSMGDSTVS